MPALHADDDDADAMEHALAGESAARLQALLCEAARRVCPEHAKVFELPKERVRPLQACGAGPDFACRAPATVWRRLRSGLAPDDPVRVRTVSEFGLERHAEYRTASELAAAVLLEVCPQAVSAAVADLRVREADGSLLCTTHLHMRRQRARGMLHCASCGAFLHGERGLRDHQQRVHASHYAVAQQAVHEARTALIQFSPARSTEAWLAAVWSARREEAERARNSLSAGLRAARDGDVTALERLAAAGWDAASDVDRHGSGALMWAAGSGRLAACRYLVDSCGLAVDGAQKKDGRTPLHFAARNGHVDVCRWLCSRGACADAPTHDMTRPLHWAVWQARLGVCALLVDELGADVHARNSYGCNAVQWAAQCAAGDDETMCRWLVERGVDMALLNGNGHSALHKAAVKGHRRICEYLLSDDVGLGIAHLAADQDGNTPMLMARLDGHVELAEYLEAEAQARARRA